MQLVALKKINIYSRSNRHQLDKELTAFAKVQHPNIVGCLGGFLEEGRIVMALEYMNMGSLESVVENVGILPEPCIWAVAKQILLGLAHLHDVQILHRDLKPENVLVMCTGVVKISDFGLAKELAGEDNNFTSTMLGTRWILSPERATNERYTFSADIWSFGMSLIYCAAGDIPIPTDYWKMLECITMKAPSLDETIFSNSLCSFVDGCLTLDPAKRATARMLLENKSVSTSSLIPLQKFLTKSQTGNEMKVVASEINKVMTRILTKPGCGGQTISTIKSMVSSGPQTFQQAAAQFKVKASELCQLFEELINNGIHKQTEGN